MKEKRIQYALEGEREQRAAGEATVVREFLCLAALMHANCAKGINGE